MKFWQLASASTALVLSTSVNAAIISTDWLAAGDNLITKDTDTGLEWLDLTATGNRSYNDINNNLGPGGEFDGWRYATETDVVGFFDSFGGNSTFYDGWSIENNGLFDLIAPFWGDLQCEQITCDTGEGQSAFYVKRDGNNGTVGIGQIYDESTYFRSHTEDAISVYATDADSNQRSHPHIYRGSALVRGDAVSVVPIPAAVWLFGSGLLGLVGIARRKKA